MIPEHTDSDIGSGIQIFGRANELAQINTFVRTIPDRGGALLVRGQPGIGKTTLLKAARSRAGSLEIRLLETSGVQSEAELPFAGLHQLVLPVLGEADRLSEPQRGALLAAFGMAQTEVLDRFMIALATFELISNSAKHRPVLITIDDAQWLDRSTAGVLTFVARRLANQPIGMLVAMREGARSLLEDVGLHELRLGRIDEEAASELLESKGVSLPPYLRRKVLEQAAGNPLALIELPATLETASSSDVSSQYAHLPLSERLEHTFAERSNSLPEVAQTILLVAAAEDGGVLSEVVGAAAIMHGNEVSTADLKPAVDAGLIQIYGPRLTFRHPLVRSALYQQANLAERNAVHCALVRVFESQPDRQVWHRAAALTEPDETVATELDAMAERAQRRGAVSVAIEALERAVALSVDRPSQGRRLIDATELSQQMGRYNDLARLMRHAQSLDLAPLERARVEWLRENSEESQWSGAAKIRTFVQIANQMSRDGDTERAVKALLTIALRCWWSNPEQEIRELVAATAERLSVSEREPEIIAILALSDPIERGAGIVEHLSGLEPEAGAEAEQLRLLATAATAVGAFDRTMPLIAASVAGLRAQGRLGLLAQALVTQATAAVNLGNASVALPVCEEAERLARDTSQPLWMAVAGLIQARAMAIRGDTETAEGLVVESERRLLPIAANPMLALAAVARGTSASSGGRHVETYEHLSRIFEPSDNHYHPFVRSWVIGDFVEAAVETGHTSAALKVMEEMEKLAAKAHSPILRVGLSYARPLLASEEHAGRLFEDGLKDNMANWPFACARLQLAYGVWLRRRRRILEARAHLGAAREAFEALDARPWSERSRQEQRAAGVSAAASASAEIEELTPQELQIVRMAAAGLSNREIGEQLHLSHRTVGSHLYRAFPKLGITSRGQLRQALEKLEPQPDI